jgi:hypothetical protein
MAHLPTLVLSTPRRSGHCVTGLKGLLYPSELNLHSIVHLLLLGFMFLKYFLRSVIHNCDDEVKVIDSENSLHLSHGGFGFLPGRGFQGRNLPLIQGISLISRRFYFSLILLIFFSIYLFYFVITPSAR